MSQDFSQYTGVSEHDARHVQEEYLQTVEALAQIIAEVIQALMKIAKDNEPNPDRPTEGEFTLIDNGEVVAGWVNQVYVDKTSEQFWKELAQVLATPAGEKAEGCAWKQITLDGKVILQSDSEGNVLINEVIENPEIRQKLGLNIPGITALLALYEEQRKQIQQKIEQENNQIKEEELKHVNNENDIINTDYSVITDYSAEAEDLFMYENDEFDIPSEEQEAFFNNSHFSITPEDVKIQADTATTIKNTTQVEAPTSIPQTNPQVTEVVERTNIQAFRDALSTGDYSGMRAAVQDLPQEEKLKVFNQLSDQEKFNAIDLALGNNERASSQPAQQSAQQAPQPQSSQRPQEPQVASPVANETLYVEPKNENIFRKLVRIWQEVTQSVADLFKGKEEPNFEHKSESPNLDESKLEEPKSKEANPYAISETAKAIKRDKEFAKNIYNEFHATAGESGSLMTQKYTINNQGNNYQVRDNFTGEQLFSFKNTLTGLKVENSNLTDTARQDFKNLGESRKVGQRSEAFTPVGAKDSEIINRGMQIANFLTQAAKNANSNLQVDGNNFDYKWAAKPNGEVSVWKKGADGNELLLSRSSKGDMQFNMSEKDMRHFESMAPALQSVGRAPAQQTSAPASTRGQNGR